MKKIINFFSFFLILLFFLPSQAYASETIVINEFLAHPSSGNKEWVEFYNPDNIDLSSYFLDDDTDFNSDTGSSSKKSLTTINNSSSSYPYFEISSFLNNDGDYVVLFSPTGEIIDQYQFTEDPGADIPIGRFPDGDGEFAILSSSTKGGPNYAPPTPTLAPTATPTPTKTTASKSTSKTPTVASTKSSLSPTVFQGAKSQTLNYKAVLGEKNQSTVKLSAEEKISTPSPRVKNEEKSNEVKTLGATQNNLPKILIAIGVVLVAICGILFGRPFWKKLSERKSE
ncbi:MAG: lamin tail domain-containing protein [Candidatus Levybacteria bacterium]|nr:lamin tail domain-containing protein [Candidatus Levybacteria bacterium]